MAASFVVHTGAKLPRYGTVKTLADGTNGRQIIGWETQRRVSIFWATVAEAKAIIEAQFPGGVGDFQLDSTPNLIPVVDQITNLVNASLTGTKLTHTVS